MIRLEVRTIYGKFPDRFKPPAPVSTDTGDPAALRFESELENKDHLRATLECVPEETRKLILEVFAATDGNLKKRRDHLAASLGLTRSALDQRLSRAYHRLRDRMDRNHRAPKP